MTAERRALVLDTNIVLDLFVFQDPATAPLQTALHDNSFRWIASAPMRDELARVLTYPQIVRRLAQQGHQATDGAANRRADPLAWVLAKFDAQVTIVPVVAKASVTCRDPDDQKFIDLAVVHQAVLLSKDKAVLCMKKRLLALSVHAQAAIE